VLLVVWGLADNDAILSVPLLIGVCLPTFLELGKRIYGIVGSLGTIGIMSVILVEFSDRVKIGDLSRYFQKMLVVFLGWSCLWLLFIYSFWYLLEGRIFVFLNLQICCII
jgi:hypothetical protein